MHANDSAYAACLLDTAQDWEWSVADSLYPQGASYCLSVNGQLPPHQFLQFTDVNPNSPTYNQTKWVDQGADSACPANTYFSNTESGNFTRNNCGTGYTGSTVTYTIPTGKYSSTVSQAAADNQAINDVNTNGQSYANTNGTCNQNCSYTANTNWSIVSGGISSTGSTVSFYIAFRYVPGNPSWGSNNQIATITGCRPSVNRIITMSASGDTWQVTVTPAGLFYVQLMSGTPPAGNATIGLTGGSYPL
jgi:hypothetical protein